MKTRLIWAVVPAVALLTAGSAHAGMKRQGATKDGKVYTHHHKFKIPFSSPDATQSMVLYCSADRGQNWKEVRKAPAGNGEFDYRVDAEGEFWFATRAGASGGRSPVGVTRPDLMVVVDATAPELKVQQAPNRRGMLGVTWTMNDPNVDVGSFQLHRKAGDRWVKVDTMMGRWQAYWPRGESADPVSVRATVGDLSGNKTTVRLQVGGAGRPAAASTATDDWMPDALKPRQETPAAPTRQASDTPPRRPAETEVAQREPIEPAPQPALAVPLMPPNTQWINARGFAVTYAIDDVGPSGLSKVELWYTRDRGRTWKLFGLDHDRESPIEFESEEDGLYGISLVARSGVGKGDQPPGAGTPAQMYVMIDATAPVVQLRHPEPGTGDHGNFLYIRWRAVDQNLGPRPVSLYYSVDEVQWQPIAEKVANAGNFAWPLPLGVPHQFFVRITVDDRAGNRAEAVTHEAVVVDQARPKGRVLYVGPRPKAETPKAQSTAPSVHIGNVVTTGPTVEPTPAVQPPTPTPAPTPRAEVSAPDPVTVDEDMRAKAIRLKSEADYYVLSGDFIRARALLADAIATWPSFAIAHNELAGVYYKLGRYDDASRHFGIAMKLAPSDPKPVFGMASVYLKARDYRQARAMLTRVVELDRGDMEALVRLASVCLKIHEQTQQPQMRTEAIGYLQTAVQRGAPSNKFVVHAQDMLKQLH